MKQPVEDKPGFADDTHLTHYLLGMLDDEQVERLDEAAIVDDDVAARLRVVETDLIDAYVRGRLSGDVLEHFESRYLASPRRRDGVKFAERFVPAVDRAGGVTPDSHAHSDVSASEKPVHTPPPEPRADSPRTRRSWPTLKFMAAAALLAIASGVLLLQFVRLRNGLTVAERSREASAERVEALARQLDEQRVAGASATQALERARASLGAAHSAAAGAAAATSPAMALVLLPQTRAGGPIATLAVPDGTDAVRFDLQLESNDYPRYDATLADPATNGVVWRSGTLTAASRRDGSSVLVAVPGRLLKAQHYTLALIGHSASGATEVAGSYTFQIVRR